MKTIFLNKDWKEVERTRCEIYTRVMWYHRPVGNFNIWKKSEFYSRKYFLEQNENQNFVEQYC